MATLFVFLVTTAFMIAQSAEPSVLETLRRRPGAVADGELWRLISPLVVHSNGWLHFVATMTGLWALGPVLERRVGPWRWLLLYFGSAIPGEVLGIAWRPHGAGASLGVSGLFGALVADFAWRLKPSARAAVFVLFLLLVVTTAVFRDVHGLPALVGAVLWRITRAEEVRNPSRDVTGT